MAKLRTIAEYSISELFSRLRGEGEIKYCVDSITYNVNKGSLRYETFRASLSCIECGLIGNVLKLETSSMVRQLQTSEHVQYAVCCGHFNLYARDSHGNEILMTKDHVIPKSKGGPDVSWNLQTMCRNCNEKKGNFDHLPTKQPKKRKYRCRAEGCRARRVGEFFCEKCSKRENVVLKPHRPPEAA